MFEDCGCADWHTYVLKKEDTMELTDKSLIITRQEASVLADFLHDFDGLNGRGFDGSDLAGEEHRLKGRLAAIAAYKLVSPDHNAHALQSSDVLEIPHGSLFEMQKVIDARLMNPVSAIDRMCAYEDDRGWTSYNSHAREDAFKRLAWLAGVHSALSLVRESPHYPIDIINQRFSGLEQLSLDELLDNDLYEGEDE